MAGGEAAHPLATERLNRYWTEGPGAAKIRWGVPGDFDRCVTQMRKVGVPDHMVKGHCANLHKRATGGWPGHAPGAEQALAAARRAKNAGGKVLGEDDTLIKVTGVDVLPDGTFDVHYERAHPPQ